MVEKCLIIIFSLHRHSDPDDPNNTSQPRELERPDGKPGPKQRPSGVHVTRQPPSHGPTSPAVELQPPTDAQHSAKHAEPNIIERAAKPWTAKLLV